MSRNSLYRLALTLGTLDRMKAWGMLGVAFCSLLVIAGCPPADEPVNTMCVYLATRSCSCDGGPASTQTCLQSGVYGDCACTNDEPVALDVGCDSNAPNCAKLTGDSVTRQPFCEAAHTPTTPHDEFNHCVFACAIVGDGGDVVEDDDATALCHTLGGQCVAPGISGAVPICVPN